MAPEEAHDSHAELFLRWPKKINASSMNASCDAPRSFAGATLFCAFPATSAQKLPDARMVARVCVP